MWNLKDKVTGISQDVWILGGENLSQIYTKSTKVFWPLRGSSPITQSGPSRKPSFDLENTPIVTESESDFNAVRTILLSGNPIELTTEYGEIIPCLPTSDLRVELLDTPGRSTRPIRHISVELQVL